VEAGMTEKGAEMIIGCNVTVGNRYACS